MTERWDAVVVGAGPNGLVAAATLARAGRSVVVLERADAIGGGLRSDLLDGLIRDRCAAVMPFGVASPALLELDLERHGLRWAQPDVPFTQPLDGGRVGAALRDLDATVDLLGPDGDRYRKLVQPFVESWEALSAEVQQPIAHMPRHPLLLARYGLSGVRSARHLVSRFSTEEAKGLFAGCAAHGVLPLEAPFTAAFGTLFAASAHAVGWPVVQGGSGRLAEALAAVIVDNGGEIRTDVHVDSYADLPPHDAAIFDTDLRQLGAIAGDRLSARYRRAIARFRSGPGACKVDHVLSGPVPWADPHSHRAGTVHVGGTFDETAAAEAEVATGRHPERPFVLVVQQDAADPTRVGDDGRRTLWSYTHVPNGSHADCSETIEAQIERFAPGFRDLIIGREVTTAPAFETYNPNYIGGDITGGAHSARQLIARPRLFRPHRTSDPTIYLCSASSAPGAGVHGTGGRLAAEAVLAAA
ncbi:MAG: NAD(P)/FAD-dependent oxidoreductase [Actinomycetota bacterium]